MRGGGYRLKAAISLALSFFICVPLLAAETAPVPTDDNHAYTLTKVEESGINTITKYEWSETENRVVPVYYRVDLKQTEYGSGDGIKYYEWTKNAQGNNEFSEVTTPTDGKTTITVKYDTGNLQNRIDNTEDLSSETITGAFVNQTTGSTTGTQAGGAIYNHGANSKLGDINADFIGNFVLSNDSDVSGGVINNSGIIGNITGNFIGNSASAKTGIYGGVINNFSGEIGNVTGNFIGNYILAQDSYASGAVINNGQLNQTAVMGDVIANFIGNYGISINHDANGGALYNRSKMGNVAGDFINNYVESKNASATGGAIVNFYAGSTIENITSDFIGNYALGYKNGLAGAIYNGTGSSIKDITGDFINNYAASTSSYSYGGAILNYGEISDINGNFINNYVASANTSYGGALYNRYGVVGNITGNFIGNYTTGRSGRGAAVYNQSATIGNIKGDFIGNYVYFTGASGSGGGAIYSSHERSTTDASLSDVTIKSIEGDFIGNYALTTEGNAYGGAIYNMGYIESIKGDFIGNYVFSESYKTTGGAIANDGGIIEKITGNFVNNHASGMNAKGGAVANYIVALPDQDKAVINFVNSSFLNNYATALNIEDSEMDTAKGGAIFTNYDMTLNADNGVSLISGNYTEENGQREQNAIYVANFADENGIIQRKTTLTLNAVNDGKVVVDDNISGGSYYHATNDPKYWQTSEHAYNLKLTGDESGAIYLNNEIKNADISIDTTNIYVNEGTNLSPSRTLAVNSGILNIQHLNNETVNFQRFSNAGTINLSSVDVDLKNESMGRITSDEYGESTGRINVAGLNLLNDATKATTNILFADTALKGNVAYTGTSPIAYSPIYKYEVSYNPDDGFFTFVRGAGSAIKDSGAYNPAVLVSPVVQQAGAYTAQLQAYNYAFQHADTFMNIPYTERLSIMHSGRYAMSPTGDATDVGTFSPLLTKEEDAGFWVKPYASFENIPLKNGPKVSNINYGTLVGYDSQLTPIRNGFERVLTGYIGYNGASQRYSGVDAYQNGGLIGGTATFYNGNFFNATTLSVGATAGDATTMYGSENYTMLLAGIGNKTGYNFEFWDGKVILQPNFLISYTLVNTFDYNNAAGVRIESDPLHAIQLAPGIKLIGNTKNGWQPYIGVNMVWNLLDDSRVTANDVRLPEMSIKPYVQYGAGIQKRFKDRFLAFGQAMIHNGGRNGISLTAGLRWKVGRE